MNWMVCRMSVHNVIVLSVHKCVLIILIAGSACTLQVHDDVFFKSLVVHRI